MPWQCPQPAFVVFSICSCMCLIMITWQPLMLRNLHRNPCTCDACFLLLPNAPSSTRTGNPRLVSTFSSGTYCTNTFTIVEKSCEVRSSLLLKDEFLPIGESEKMKVRLVVGGNMQHMYRDFTHNGGHVMIISGSSR